MKRYGAFCLLAAVALVWTTSSATARPQYKKEFDAIYVKDKDSKIAAAAKEAKCNNCHYGKSKKNRNDYGKALSKHVNKKVFNQLKKNKAALAKKVQDALKAVLKEKSSSGETFGKRIQDGKLPGTAPKE